MAHGSSRVTRSGCSVTPALTPTSTPMRMCGEHPEATRVWSGQPDHKKPNAPPSGGAWAKSRFERFRLRRLLATVSVDRDPKESFGARLIYAPPRSSRTPCVAEPSDAHRLCSSGGIAPRRLATTIPDGHSPRQEDRLEESEVTASAATRAFNTPDQPLNWAQHPVQTVRRSGCGTTTVAARVRRRLPRPSDEPRVE